MSEKSIEKSLELYDYVVNTVNEEFSKLLDFAKEFHEKYRIEKLKLPYHINVIDELHINENGHSRILTKLLDYRDQNGKYIFLQSLINYIKRHIKSSEFAKLEISSPTITQEYKRIDLWVRDANGYSIIFENKVFNAQDQEAQLSRYIEKTLDEQYMLDRIFVVYLSNSGKEPDVQSWGKYQKDFVNRYCNLSFKDDILHWLKEIASSTSDDRDVYLKYAIFEYIDYLEGMFGLRQIEKNMNMNLEQLINDHLHLEVCKSDEDRFKKVKDALIGINELQKEVDKIMHSYGKKILQEAVSSILQNDKVRCDDKKTDYTRLITSYYGKDILVSVDWYNHYGPKLYCQVEYINHDQLSDDDNLEKTLKNILTTNNNGTQRWKEFEMDDYFGVTECLKQVFNSIT